MSPKYGPKARADMVLVRSFCQQHAGMRRHLRFGMAAAGAFATAASAAGQPMQSSSPVDDPPYSLPAVAVTETLDGYAQPASRTATRTATPSLRGGSYVIVDHAAVVGWA
ncbi:hypothetical protein [Xanthomonas medicagonis]|uniref:hypothetical protein n=1 Tax=Xanthomonas medicagonis TaxID=3160841 RepID=UPI00351942F1